jgi:hypothetical protein
MPVENIEDVPTLFLLQRKCESVLGKPGKVHKHDGHHIVNVSYLSHFVNNLKTENLLSLGVQVGEEEK